MTLTAGLLTELARDLRLAIDGLVACLEPVAPLAGPATWEGPASDACRDALRVCGRDVEDAVWALVQELRALEALAADRAALERAAAMAAHPTAGAGHAF